MYEMLTGLPPFYSQDVQQMYSKIMSAKVKYPDTISSDAKDLLQSVFSFSFSFFLSVTKNKILFFFSHFCSFFSLSLAS